MIKSGMDDSHIDHLPTGLDPRISTLNHNGIVPVEETNKKMLNFTLPVGREIQKRQNLRCEMWV
jgi:hypothetical protein